MSDKMTKNKQTKGFEYQPYEKLTKIHKKNRKGRTNINNRKTKEMECPNLPIERVRVPSGDAIPLSTEDK